MLQFIVIDSGKNFIEVGYTVAGLKAIMAGTYAEEDKVEEEVRLMVVHPGVELKDMRLIIEELKNELIKEKTASTSLLTLQEELQGLEELRAQLAELRTMIKAKLDKFYSLAVELGLNCNDFLFGVVLTISALQKIGVAIKEFQTEYLVLVVAVVPTVAVLCITTVAESGFSSLDYDTRARVQSMCAGTFDEKTDTEAWTFLNDVADKTYQWQTMREEIPSHRANVHQVDSNSESATLRTILEKIENLETGKRERHPNTSSVNHVVMPNCVVCESSDHLVQDCPDVLSLREGRKDQANAMYQRPNNQPFNGGWNNNSNNSNSRGNRNYQGGSSGSAPYQPHNQVNQHQSSSSWQQNPSYQAPLNVPYVPPHNRNLPPPTTSLEDTLKAFMQVTQSSIAKLEGQIGQMATEISTRDKGTFPSQTQANPKGILNILDLPIVMESTPSFLLGAVRKLIIW
ncbi:hypothetical protein GIB67_020405 [Kingdonia uniflora]|uniref:Uncharacterized protein n=1 Tax=Kingdonia uniflora TaxID=39325 RepID=A0A7J7NWS0_9MAGN|nr:hypothetical protein GIB67_020405 [Kingdonia uniflora]